MVQNASAFQNLTDLDPVLTEVFFQKYLQYNPILIGTVFGVRNSQKSKETHKRIGSMPEPVAWEGQVAYGAAADDYEITWNHTKYSRGFIVEEDLLADNQISGVFDTAGNLGQAFNRKIVKDEASVFNNAFSGSYLGYDAKALCATDHPQSQSVSTAVSNYAGAIPLTEDNLETAIVQLEGLGDDLGEETAAMATHLVVGRSNRRKALELTMSDRSPGTGNNAVNTFTSLTPVVHPMITGNKWFVVDAPSALTQMIWYWRLMAEFRSVDDLGNTEARKFWGKMRYSFGWQDFRWLVGSNPA